MTSYSKICTICFKSFEKPKKISIKQWEDRVTCSTVCAKKSQSKKKRGLRFSPKTEFKKGQKAINPFKKGHKPWNTGKPHLTREKHPFWGKQRPEMTGEKHFNWKGNAVSYSGLHYWVKRELGIPGQCEYCEVKGEYTYYKKDGKELRRWNIQWANISDEYKRIKSDWKALCIKCHRAFDGWPSIETRNKMSKPKKRIEMQQR